MLFIIFSTESLGASKGNISILPCVPPQASNDKEAVNAKKVNILVVHTILVIKTIITKCKIFIA